MSTTMSVKLCYLKTTNKQKCSIFFLSLFSNKWLSQREAVDQLALPSGPLGSCTTSLWAPDARHKNSAAIFIASLSGHRINIQNLQSFAPLMAASNYSKEEEQLWLCQSPIPTCFS